MARDGSKARNIPGAKVMLYIPVPINRRNHTKDAVSKCQMMLYCKTQGKYLGRRRKPNGAFQIVVRKKGPIKRPVERGFNVIP
jgi:hypothetical protein